MDNEKYDKIRKQQAKSRALSVSIMSLVLLVVVGVLFYKKDTPSSLRSAVESVETSLSAIRPVSIEELVQHVSELDAEVRRIKATGIIMETDPESLAATKKLQDATRRLMAARYGSKEPYRVNVTLEFQDTIPDFAEKGPQGSFLLEMAPSSLVPHSIFSFLEIARQWKTGAFHRIAGHVLQVQVNGPFKSLAFQEYSEKYPHRKGTVGYAGRPSGPAWYVSILDNTVNHGPGSQQNHNPYEADSCFGKVIKGYDTDVQRIAKIKEKGFMTDPRKFVKIKGMKILVPSSGSDAVDGYVEWKEEL